MKILVACEYSGTVRNAFIKKGHNAISCDLLPTDKPGPHYQGDVKDILYGDWDLVIAHPPCDHLAISGSQWFPAKIADGRQQQGIDFFMMFTKLSCKWAIENPVGIMSTRYRKPDQIIHPWQYGHGETKKTCLWLNGLPLLKPTDIVEGRNPKVWNCKGAPKGVPRWKWRSVTYQGIADAMAEQWG
jgi:hypothetical protein